MDKKYWWVLGVLIVIALLIGAYWHSPQDASGNTIKIGAILPLSGPAAYYGEQSKKGIELALDEMKKEFPGESIEVTYEDNLATAKGALDAYQKIKNSGGVNAVITGSSASTLAIKPAVQSDGTLMMGVHVTADGYSTPNDLSFRVSPAGSLQTPVITEYLKKIQIKSVAIIYLNNDYGVSVKNSFLSDIKEQQAAINVVAEEGYLLDAQDYRTSLLKIKEKKPDIIFVVGLASQIAKILSQSSELALGIPFVSTHGAEDPVLLKVAGDAANGVAYSYTFDAGSSTGFSDFTKAFEAKYGVLPDAYAAEGYEAMKLTAQALRECNNDSSCAQKYLTNLKDYPSALGPLSFDENGDVSYPVFMKTVKDGKFVELEQ